MKNQKKSAMPWTLIWFGDALKALREMDPMAALTLSNGLLIEMCELHKDHEWVKAGFPNIKKDQQ